MPFPNHRCLQETSATGTSNVRFIQTWPTGHAWHAKAHLSLSLNGSASRLERGCFCAARRAQNPPSSAWTISPCANSSSSSTAAATALGHSSASVTSRSRRQPEIGEPSLDKSRHTFCMCVLRCEHSVHAARKTFTAHGHKATRCAPMRWATSANAPVVGTVSRTSRSHSAGKLCAPLLDKMSSMSTLESSRNSTRARAASRVSASRRTSSGASCVAKKTNASAATAHRILGALVAAREGHSDCCLHA